MVFFQLKLTNRPSSIVLRGVVASAGLVSSRGTFVRLVGTASQIQIGRYVGKRDEKKRWKEVRVEEIGVIEVMRGEDCAASTYHIPIIIAITWVHTI